MLGLITVIILFSISLVEASIFDFFNQHQQQQQQHHQQQEEGGRFNNPLDYENEVLETNCNKYLCPDTSICVDSPKFCPCPYPSSQLRCFLPNSRYVCISKPAGDFNGEYDDPSVNWKIDAKDDNIIDCGWVNRAWKGLI